MKFSHSMLMIFSGIIWFAVGLYLLPLGIHFLLDLPQGPILSTIASFGLSLQNAALAILILGLLIGHFKSRTVFAKTVDKAVAHIRTLPEKASLFSVYTPKYLLLLGLMMLIGLSMKWFRVPLDVRGLVDVAVGSALINGSLHYFKASLKRPLKDV